MDKSPLVSRLNKLVPGSVLEVRRFGRSSIASIWIETQSIQKVAAVLKDDLECKLDWLENLSVVEFEGVFVVTYFLRSTMTKYHVVIRLSILPQSAVDEVILPSVEHIWPMAMPMEKEAQEMFGLNFKTANDSLSHVSSYRIDGTRILPEGLDGFPLRKSYKMNMNFINMHSMRAFVSRSSVKKNQQ